MATVCSKWADRAPSAVTAVHPSDSTFTAGDKDVLMKGGTAGGGYAGLSARIAKESRDWLLLDSEGRQDPASAAATVTTTRTQSLCPHQLLALQFLLTAERLPQPFLCGIQLDHRSDQRHVFAALAVFDAHAEFHFQPLSEHIHTRYAGDQQRIDLGRTLTVDLHTLPQLSFYDCDLARIEKFIRSQSR